MKNKPHSYKKQMMAFIMLTASVTMLSSCETFLGTPGKTAKNPRTASFEQRRDEEIFSASYEVNFDSGSFKLDQEGRAKIDHVATLIRQARPTLIQIAGYSDTYGDSAYNKKISQKRAQSVATALKEHGVNAALIRTEAHGEADPLVPTQDNVKILENRRVVIQIKK